MGRIVLLIFYFAFLVAGVLNAASAIHAGYRAHVPIEDEDLLVFTGRLSRVTTCSTGKRPGFWYFVTNADRTIEVQEGCPSTHQAELAKLTGTDVTIRYEIQRGLIFIPQVRVRELVSGGQSLWKNPAFTAQESVGFFNLLTAMWFLAGLGMSWQGWREMKSAWRNSEG